MENQERPPRSQNSFRGRPQMRPSYGNGSPYTGAPYVPIMYPNSSYNPPTEESDELKKLKEEAKKRLEESQVKKANYAIAFSDGPPVGGKGITFSDGPPKAKDVKKEATTTVKPTPPVVKPQEKAPVKIESKPTLTSTPSKAILIESGPGNAPPTTKSDVAKPIETKKTPVPSSSPVPSKPFVKKQQQPSTDKPTEKPTDKQPVKRQPPPRDIKPVKPVVQKPAGPPNWANIASRTAPIRPPPKREAPPTRSPNRSPKSPEVIKPTSSSTSNIKKSSPTPPKSESSKSSPQLKPPQAAPQAVQQEPKKEPIQPVKPVAPTPALKPQPPVKQQPPVVNKSVEPTPKPATPAPLDTKSTTSIPSKSPRPHSPNKPHSPLKPNASWRSDQDPVPPPDKQWRSTTNPPNPHDDSDFEEDPDNLLSDQIIDFLTEWNDFYQANKKKQPRPYTDIQLIYSIQYLSRMRDNEATPPYVNPELHMQLFTNLSMRKKQKIFKNKRRSNHKKRFTETELLAQEMGLTGNLDQAQVKWDPRKQELDPLIAFTNKLTGFLNKLTKENFDQITSDILNSVISNVSDTKIQAFVSIIFDKAILEPHFVKIYADCCKLLYDHLSQSPDSKPFAVLLFSSLAQTCQQNFEQRPKWSELQLVIEQSGATTGQDISEEEMRVIYMKKRSLGNIQFVGALFTSGIISGSIIFTVLTLCLQHEVADDIELAITLLSSTGYFMKTYLDTTPATTQYKERYAQCYYRIKQISQNKEISSRVRFMCLDILDKKRLGFKGSEGPKKLKELEIENEQRRSSERQDSRPQSRGFDRRDNRDNRRDDRGSFRRDDRDSRGGSFRNNTSGGSSPFSKSRSSSFRDDNRDKSGYQKTVYNSRDRPRENRDNRSKPTPFNTQQKNKFEQLRKQGPSTPVTPVAATGDTLADTKHKFKSNFKEFVKSGVSVDLVQFLETVNTLHKVEISKEWMWMMIEGLPEQVVSGLTPFKGFVMDKDKKVPELIVQGLEEW